MNMHGSFHFLSVLAFNFKGAFKKERKTLGEIHGISD
jgi:hypothetical protein